MYYYASFFFLIIDLNLLIAEVITQIFDPVAELIILIWIATKERKVEIETHEVILEITISKGGM